MAQVVMIHAQNQVETLKVLGLDLTPTQARQIIATGCRCVGGAAIRRLAQMPVTGTGRIDRYPFSQASLLRTVTEHPLSRRRAADIAQTDEQNAHQAPSRRRTRCRSSGVSTPVGGASRASATC